MGENLESEDEDSAQEVKRINTVFSIDESYFGASKVLKDRDNDDIAFPTHTRKRITGSRSAVTIYQKMAELYTNFNVSVYGEILIYHFLFFCVLGPFVTIIIKAKGNPKLAENMAFIGC